MKQKINIAIYNFFHKLWLKWRKINSELGLSVIDMLSNLKNRVIFLFIPITCMNISLIEFIYHIVFDASYKISIYSMVGIYISSILFILFVLVLFYVDIKRGSK